MPTKKLISGYDILEDITGLESDLVAMCYKQNADTPTRTATRGVRLSALLDNFTDMQARATQKALVSDVDQTMYYYLYEEKKPSGFIYIYFRRLQFTGVPTSPGYGDPQYSAIYDAVGETFHGTSPEGVECIKIHASHMLVFDTQTSAFSVIHHNTKQHYHKIIALNETGMLTQGAIFDAITRKQLLDNTILADKMFRTDNEVYALSRRVQKAQTAKTYTMLFMTDTHTSILERPMIWMPTMRTFQTVGSLRKHVNIACAIHGGDLLTVGYTDKTDSIETASRASAAWRMCCGDDAIMAKGNHDDASYGPSNGSFWDANKNPTVAIGQTEWAMSVQNASRRCKTVVFDDNNPLGGYCYIDDDTSKIRTIVLNTGDLPETLDGNGDYKYTMITHSAFGNSQLNFVANALQFTGKSTPSDWAVLFVSHIPPERVPKNADGNNLRFGMTDMAITNAPAFFGILNAYRDGTTYYNEGTTTDFEYTVDVTYAHEGEVIGFICGHTHADNTSAGVGGIGAVEYGYRYISVSGGQTFAGITVNRDAKTIHITKHGGNTYINPATDIYKTIFGLSASDVDANGDYSVTYN